jgi:hypothetical protein
MGVLTHELMHLVQNVALSAGMSAEVRTYLPAPNHTMPNPDRHPSWFTEGVAQALSGHNGWIQSWHGEAHVRSILAALPSHPGTGQARMYDAGYLATMYLAYVAGGRDMNNMAAGLNYVLRRIALGESMNAVVSDVTGFASLTAFENWIRNNTANHSIVDFSMRLISEMGSGSGSLMLPGGVSSSFSTILGNGAGRSDVFINLLNTVGMVGNDVYGYYFNIRAGGGRYQGNPPVSVGEIITNGPGNGNGTDPGNGPGNGPGTTIPPPLPAPPGVGRASPTGNGLWLQIGANSGQGMRIHISALDAESLGLRIGGYNLINVAQESGQEISRLLNKLDTALDFTNKERSSLGAKQNRLEFTSRGLSISSENLSDSKSRIRDADIAREMMVLAASNILQQAGISILAQANNATNNALQLLRG